MDGIVSARKTIYSLSAIAVIGAVYFYLFSLYVPFSMDEFSSYYILSCAYYPFMKLAGECGCHALAPFGDHFFPVRTCPYAGGILSCLAYYLLFELWPSPYSARLLDLIFLFLQAFILHRAFKVDLLLSFVLLLFFMPYAFQHMVDTGPIIFHTISVFLVYYMTQKWKRSLKNNLRDSWKYPVLIGMVLFLCIYTKLVYFTLLPGVLILLVYCLFYDEPALGSQLHVRAVKIGGQLLLLCATLGVLGLILFNSRDRDNVKYFFVLTQIKSIPDPRQFLKHLWELCGYLTNPLRSAERVLMWSSARMTLGGVLLAGTIIALLGYGMAQCRKKGMGYGFIVVNVLLFLLTFISLAKIDGEVIMHHVILCYPFGILAIFYVYSRLSADRFVVWMTALFLIVNLGLYRQATTLPTLRHSDMSNVRVINLINERYSEGYVIVIIDWGLWYMQSVYGAKDQCVVWIDRWDESEPIARLKEILRNTGRKALFVGFWDSQHKWSAVKQHFPDIVPLRTDINTGEWRIWYQPYNRSNPGRQATDAKIGG